LIRPFKVYYLPLSLVLLHGEALIVWHSFLLATMWRNPDLWLFFDVESGYLQVLAKIGTRILVVTDVAPPFALQNRIRLTSLR
jgi:hypothetical protein